MKKVLLGIINWKGCSFKNCKSPWLMAAINHGGTFYRLEESSQSGDCGEANVMALHLASKQVMPFAFAVKGIPFGKASLKLKRKATASE